MSNQVWQLHPRQGISFESVHIQLDQDRLDVRAMLKALLSEQKGSNQFINEDNFTTDDGSTFIRLRYDSNNKVQDIEFIHGTLQYQGINIHERTTLQEVVNHFKKINLSFRDTEWLGDGQDCVELGINIATHEDVGGDGDGIEWVILSKNFK